MTTFLLYVPYNPCFFICDALKCGAYFVIKVTQIKLQKFVVVSFHIAINNYHHNV